MKPSRKDILEILRTIECQHRQYAHAERCPAAEYLRHEWGLWASILEREHPGQMLPATHWHSSTQ